MIAEDHIGIHRVEGSSSAPQTLDRYAYVANNPTTRTDPSGQCAVDTFADVGFIAYDLVSLVFGPPKERSENLTAFGADLVGAAIPCATGLGLAAHAGIKWVGRETKILEGPNAIRSAAHVFGVDYTKLRRCVERELRGWLGPADNVRILPNGNILPAVGDEVIGSVFDALE